MNDYYCFNVELRLLIITKKSQNLNREKLFAHFKITL